MTKARTLADFNTTSIPASVITGLPAGAMTLVSSGNVTAGDASKTLTGIFTNTYSSNEWVFPETGKWLVRLNVVQYASSASDYTTGKIAACTDSTTFNDVSQSITAATTGIAFNTGTCEALLDVTSTTNVKVKFIIDHANASNKVRGSNSINRTTMTFIRLADT